MVSRKQPSTSSSGSNVRRLNATTIASSVSVTTVRRGRLGPIGRHGAFAPLGDRLRVQPVAGGQRTGRFLRRLVGRSASNRLELAASFKLSREDLVP